MTLEISFPSFQKFETRDKIPKVRVLLLPSSSSRTTGPF